jgi:CRISPR type IV-associated protein Csf2
VAPRKKTDTTEHTTPATPAPEGPPMVRERLRFDIVLEATTPLKHLAGNEGNIGYLATRQVRLPASLGGGFASVPMISGNAMRHALREAASWCLLEASGQMNARHREEVIRLLFNGGMLAGGDGAISLAEYRRLVEFLPHLSLFGGCSGRIIPGRLEVDDALLICEETWHLLPAKVQAAVIELRVPSGGALGSASEHRAVETNVRMDSMLSPQHRGLLSESEAAKVSGRFEAREVATDAAAKDRTKSTMMPYQSETLTTGSLLYWRVDATTWSDLERDTLRLTLGAFLHNARVGGGSGTGHGRLRAVWGENLRWPSLLAAAESTDLAMLTNGKVGELFVEHVASRREAIAAFLREVEG